MCDATYSSDRICIPGMDNLAPGVQELIRAGIELAQVSFASKVGDRSTRELLSHVLKTKQARVGALAANLSDQLRTISATNAEPRREIAKPGDRVRDRSWGLEAVVRHVLTLDDGKTYYVLRSANGHISIQPIASCRLVD